MSNKKKSNQSTSFFSDSVLLEGKLVNESGQIRLDSSFEGEIFADDLDIGQNAKVKGNISANNITLTGQVEGDVTTIHKIDILSDAKISGTIKTCFLTINDGALVDSEISISSPPNNSVKEMPNLKKPSSPIKENKDTNEVENKGENGGKGGE
ncbi:MAG: polymer-forming cytoskeletal protein [SAR324 cluster bacterium]|nr:polymer-forming cytoskeletal protein [SAR324 cluster bacterium]